MPSIVHQSQSPERVPGHRGFFGRDAARCLEPEMPPEVPNAGWHDLPRTRGPVFIYPRTPGNPGLWLTNVSA